MTAQRASSDDCGSCRRSHPPARPSSRHSATTCAPTLYGCPRALPACSQPVSHQLCRSARWQVPTSHCTRPPSAGAATLPQSPQHSRRLSEPPASQAAQQRPSAAGARVHKLLAHRLACQRTARVAPPQSRAHPASQQATMASRASRCARSTQSPDCSSNHARQRTEASGPPTKPRSAVAAAQPCPTPDSSSRAHSRLQPLQGRPPKRAAADVEPHRAAAVAVPRSAAAAAHSRHTHSPPSTGRALCRRHARRAAAQHTEHHISEKCGPRCCMSQQSDGHAVHQSGPARTARETAAAAGQGRGAQRACGSSSAVQAAQLHCRHTLSGALPHSARQPLASASTSVPPAAAHLRQTRTQ